MRLVPLACAVTCAGCLSSQVPQPRSVVDPSVRSEFARLIQDPKRADEASAYAARHHLSREEVSAAVLPVYRGLMHVDAYPEAAGLAWRFGLGQSFIRAPAAFQRQRAAASAAAYIAHQNESDAKALRSGAESELRDEALIGCSFSANPADGQAAVADALAFRAATFFDEDVLLPLLPSRCPVDARWRDLIIDLAQERGLEAYALKYASESDWTPERKIRFAWTYFAEAHCGSGFKAVAALRIPAAEVVPMIEKSECEQAPIPTSGWGLVSDDASLYFFAAVRQAKFNMALTLLPFSGLAADGESFLYQEALRGGRGAEMVKTLAFHPDHHDAFMRYAFDQGRYRFVGTYAQTYEWQRKAFDKLIELGRYDFAGEVAEYGFSEALKTDGIVLAFRSAMEAGDFRMGRYFVARYGPTPSSAGLVTQAMYDQGEKEYIAAHPIVTPLPPPKAPPPKPRPSMRAPCPKGDWCVGDGK